MHRFEQVLARLRTECGERFAANRLGERGSCLLRGRERHPSKADRTGREEVWIGDERGKNLKKLSDIDCDKLFITWAPDSKSILWSGSDHKLRRVFIEEGKTEELASNDVGNIATPQFSPDGKWISFTKQDAILRSHVFVKRLPDGEDFDLDAAIEWMIEKRAGVNPGTTADLTVQKAKVRFHK